MGKKLPKVQPGLLCNKNDNGNCSSSRGLSGVFDSWQSCSSQRVKLVLGSEHPKRTIRDKTENAKLRVDDRITTVKTLMDEESSKEQTKLGPVGFLKKKQKGDERKSNLSGEKKEAEEFINKALKKYIYKDRRNHRSQHFLNALSILKSNEELFLKLIQDPDSLLAKHIRNLQELHAEKERSNLLLKSKSSEEALDTMNFQKQNFYNLVWGKIKNRNEYPSKLRKNHRPLSRVEVSENVNCYCSYLHPYSSKNKNNVVEPLYFPLKTRSQSTKEDEGIKGCIKLDIKPEIAFSNEGYSKGRDFDIVEEEAKRHLSVRLMNSNQNKCFAEKESPMSLGNILHLPQFGLFDTKLDNLRNFLNDTKGDESIPSKTDGIDQMENILSKSNDFNILELPFSPSSTNDTVDEQSIYSVSSCEKIEDSEFSGQVLPSQYERLISLLDDSVLKPENVKKLNSWDILNDKADVPSPVSVLEPLFLDEINSPPSTTCPSGNPPVQPRHIDFEEHSPMGSSPSLETISENSVNEHTLISTYIEALLQTSSLSWDELFLSCQFPYSSNQFFEPNLIDEVKFPLIDFCDHKLFFDSVNEAISEVYQFYSMNSPFISSFLSKPVFIETSVLDEIKIRVNRYFCPRELPKSIEQLAGEDHVKSQTWTDIREDIEEITIQVVELLIQEIIFEISV